MKKYIIIGSVAALVLVAVSVFALQGKNTQTATAQEVAPLAASTSSSGCGASGSGCGSIDSAGCGSASGGCGAQAANPAEAGDRLDQITAYLVDYYTNKRGLSDVEVAVESFGCHEEATVTQAGQLVEKLSINGTRISKIES